MCDAPKPAGDETGSTDTRLPPHEDAAWMRDQLGKLMQDPHVCHCTLSGEFHVIVDDFCELCEKGFVLKHKIEMPSDPVEPYEFMPVSQIKDLLQAKAALETIEAMANDAFTRGDIREPTHRPMIALAGAITQEANAGLGR